MDFEKLESLGEEELVKICKSLNIKYSTKNNSLNKLKEYYREYENLNDKYEFKNQLGNNGKDGIVYEVKDSKGNNYAIKLFKNDKSMSKIKNEVEFQKFAEKYGLSPKIVDYDYNVNYIVMEKMDKSLVDYITEKEGNLPQNVQKRIVEIMRKLDEIGIFQSDPNILNYMFKDGKLYMIDYGMCKKIDDKLKKELKTDNPNILYTLSCIILHLKNANCNPKSYEYLSKFV